MLLLFLLTSQYTIACVEDGADAFVPFTASEFVHPAVTAASTADVTVAYAVDFGTPALL